MKADERRKNILIDIQSAREPVSAAKIAAKYRVSRQIIVGDIALLRAEGARIVATPRGYIMAGTPKGAEKTIACRHTLENMEKELNIFVDNGCFVENVIVEHPVYGQLEGQLNLSSRHDVAEFMQKVRENDAVPLSGLTGGIHLHTLRAPDAAAIERAVRDLRKEGILYEE